MRPKNLEETKRCISTQRELTPPKRRGLDDKKNLASSCQEREGNSEKTSSSHHLWKGRSRCVLPGDLQGLKVAMRVPRAELLGTPTGKRQKMMLSRIKKIQSEILQTGNLRTKKSKSNAETNIPDATPLNSAVQTHPDEPSWYKRMGKERIEEEGGRRIGEKRKRKNPRSDTWSEWFAPKPIRPE